ncbi:MAG: hypothetical protein U9P14_05100 [Gemmatimonadota bacterium]|nr:hypothetical protein [Gemmatimonadota bacterium]
MNIWEIAILRSVEYLGGEANTQDIYRVLENGRFIELSPNDLLKTKWGERPAYQHQVRSHFSNLVDSGDLIRVSRGEYSLTKEGLNRILKQ